MDRKIENIEIWRAAHQLIKRYGDKADMESAQRADAALEHGDHFNFKLWTWVNTAVLQLLATTPKDGQAPD